MRKTLAVLLLLAGLHSPIFAALPIIDTFADATANGGTGYSVGSPLATQIVSTNLDGTTNVWNAVGSNFTVAGKPTVVAGNLSSTNLPPPTGNSVSFVGASGASARLNLNVAASLTNTFYYSFLVRITDLTTAPLTNANNAIAAFCDDSAAQAAMVQRLGSRLLTKRSGAGYVFGISKSATLTDFVYETNATHAVDETVFIVACHELVPNVRTNINLWINPAPSSFGTDTPPSPTVVAVSGATALNMNGVRAFGIFCQFPTAPTGIIDEVRLGTNWSFVTGGDPAITKNPADQTQPPGATATFSVEARGTAPLSYQWFKDGTTPLFNSSHISGADSATLVINNISAADLGSYSVIVTNGLGIFVKSASATLSLSDPAITSQPQSRTDDFGATATFQVTASGTGPFTYQWHKTGAGDLSDGGNISGSHSNILSISGVSFPDRGSYSVTVSNALGATAESAVAVLIVKDPIVLTQPVSVTNNAGSNVTFHVVAGGSSPFIYQWRKNGTPLSDLGNVSGSSTDTLSISSISAADEGAYSAILIGPYGDVENLAYSDDAFLTVISPVAVTVPPSSRTVPAGVRTVLAVGTSGTAPSFQWQFGETNIPGANSFAYVLTNVQPAVTGSYRVIVSNSLAVVTSTVALVSIDPSYQLRQTNLAVIRVGDGAQIPALSGNSMFLDQVTQSGSYVNTFNIPDNGSSSMIAIGLNNVSGTTGNVTSSGLTRSADGRQLVLAGYNTDLNNTVNLSTVAATAVPRGVGVINSLGQYSLVVSNKDSVFSGTAWRVAASDGTNNYWGSAGGGGTYYFGFDAPAAVVQTNFNNVRGMALCNGNLYLAGAVAGSTGILKLEGLPKILSTPTLLFPNSTGTSDVEVSPDGNLIYVADDRAPGTGGIQRWQFDGSTWSLAYLLFSGLTDGPRYVTADFSGPNPRVYAITKETSNNHIYVFDDIGTPTAATLLASSGANQTFRGIRLGPIATTAVTSPVLSISRTGNQVILSWTGGFTLQSSTNVIGPYNDVNGVTSPYTNNVSSAVQNFFRLHQ